MNQKNTRYLEKRILEDTDRLIESAIAASLLGDDAKEKEFRRGAQLIGEIAKNLKELIEVKDEYLPEILNQIISQKLPDAKVQKSLGTFSEELERIVQLGIIALGANSGFSPEHVPLVQEVEVNIPVLELEAKTRGESEFTSNELERNSEIEELVEPEQYAQIEEPEPTAEIEELKELTEMDQLENKQVEADTMEEIILQEELAVEGFEEIAAIDLTSALGKIKLPEGIEEDLVQEIDERLAVEGLAGMERLSEVEEIFEVENQDGGELIQAVGADFVEGAGEAWNLHSTEDFELSKVAGEGLDERSLDPYTLADIREQVGAIIEEYELDEPFTGPSLIEDASEDSEVSEIEIEVVNSSEESLAVEAIAPINMAIPGDIVSNTGCPSKEPGVAEEVVGDGILLGDLLSGRVQTLQAETQPVLINFLNGLETESGLATPLNLTEPEIRAANANPVPRSLEFSLGLIFPGVELLRNVSLDGVSFSYYLPSKHLAIDQEIAVEDRELKEKICQQEGITYLIIDPEDGKNPRRVERMMQRKKISTRS